jgi:periplasmic protein CpxP/Spy
MTTPLPTPPAAPGTPRRRSFFNRYAAVAFIAGAALATGVGAFARAQGMSCWHHGMAQDGPQSAAEVSAHVDHMLKHFYVEIDATDAQKAKIDPLVKQAVNDLLPLHTQLSAARAQTVQALTQTTIDRASLEAARAQHLQLADQGSKRLVQLIADVGDVLTPVQRKALVDHLQRMHGMQPS